MRLRSFRQCGKLSSITYALEEIIAPLRQSRLLAEAVDTLTREIAAEKQLRAKFYQEMTLEQKVEFIGGEVVMHSPARNRHLDVTLNLSQLITTYVRMKNVGEVKVIVVVH